MSMNWIQDARPKQGALHRQLHIPQGITIPKSEERVIMRKPVGSHLNGIAVTPLLKRRVNFAMNVRKWRE
jgi:hypothetical protein